eukprot:6209332-Pleurochrysis_carterae.AAC.4
MSSREAGCPSRAEMKSATCDRQTRRFLFRHARMHRLRAVMCAERGDQGLSCACDGLSAKEQANRDRQPYANRGLHPDANRGLHPDANRGLQLYAAAMHLSASSCDTFRPMVLAAESLHGDHTPRARCVARLLAYDGEALAVGIGADALRDGGEVLLGARDGVGREGLEQRGHLEQRGERE